MKSAVSAPRITGKRRHESARVAPAVTVGSLTKRPSSAARIRISMAVRSLIERGYSPPAHAQQAAEEARENRLESERRQRHTGDDPSHRVRVVERAEIDARPLMHGAPQQ